MERREDSVVRRLSEDGRAAGISATAACTRAAVIHHIVDAGRCHSAVRALLATRAGLVETRVGRHVGAERAVTSTTVVVVVVILVVIRAPVILRAHSIAIMAAHGLILIHAINERESRAIVGHAVIPLAALFAAALLQRENGAVTLARSRVPIANIRMLSARGKIAVVLAAVRFRLALIV